MSLVLSRKWERPSSPPLSLKSEAPCPRHLPPCPCGSRGRVFGGLRSWKQVRVARLWRSHGHLAEPWVFQGQGVTSFKATKLCSIFFERVCVCDMCIYKTTLLGHLGLESIEDPLKNPPYSQHKPSSLHRPVIPLPAPRQVVPILSNVRRLL